VCPWKVGVRLSSILYSIAICSEEDTQMVVVRTDEIENMWARTIGLPIGPPGGAAGWYHIIISCSDLRLLMCLPQASCLEASKLRRTIISRRPFMQSCLESSCFHPALYSELVQVVILSLGKSQLCFCSDAITISLRSYDEADLMSNAYTPGLLRLLDDIF
jgi:hypothetical protein